MLVRERSWLRSQQNATHKTTTRHTRRASRQHKPHNNNNNTATTDNKPQNANRHVSACTHADAAWRRTCGSSSRRCDGEKGGGGGRSESNAPLIEVGSVIGTDIRHCVLALQKTSRRGTQRSNVFCFSKGKTKSAIF